MNITFTLSEADDGYRVRDWFRWDMKGPHPIEQAEEAGTAEEAERILRAAYRGPDPDGVEVSWRIAATRGVRAISDDDIEHATLEEDLDKALVPLMAIARITSGDVAGQVFAGRDADWFAADHDERRRMLAQWIEAERAWESE